MEKLEKLKGYTHILYTHSHTVTHFLPPSLPPEITGNTVVGFTEEDIEGEFDPAHYDEAMRRVFSEEYYSEQVDKKKPVFSDSGEDGECRTVHGAFAL